MELDVMDTAAWLQGQLERTLTVIKREQEDLDQVSLTLKEIAVTKRIALDTDDYVAPEKLILFGEGMIAGEESQAELPGQEYEIPLTGSWSCRQENGGLAIATDRASYRIIPQ